MRSGEKSEHTYQFDKEYIACVGQTRYRWTDESAGIVKDFWSRNENCDSSSEDITHWEILPEDSKPYGHAETSLSCRPCKGPRTATQCRNLEIHGTSTCHEIVHHDLVAKLLRPVLSFSFSN